MNEWMREWIERLKTKLHQQKRVTKFLWQLFQDSAWIEAEGSRTLILTIPFILNAKNRYHIDRHVAGRYLPYLAACPVPWWPGGDSGAVLAGAPNIAPASWQSPTPQVRTPRGPDATRGLEACNDMRMIIMQFRSDGSYLRNTLLIA